MSELTLWERSLRYFIFNRVYVLNKHYKAIKPYLKATNQDEAAELRYFATRFEQLQRKGNVHIQIRVITYVLFYAGLGSVSLVAFKKLPLLNELASTTMVFLAIILFLTMQISKIIMKMQTCLSHLVPFYHNNKNRDSQKLLRKLKKVL